MDGYLAFVRKLPRHAYSRVSKLTRRAYGRIRTLPVRSTAGSVVGYVHQRQKQLRSQVEARILSVYRSSQVGDESADESDWSSEDEGSSSKRPRNDGGHRKARRNRSRKERKQKANKTLDDKQETVATPAPSAPVSRLAEVLSSKEGLKSAALKSSARDLLANNASDETDGKLSDDGKKRNGESTTIIKIKPPPPTAPKPRAKRTSSSQSSDFADEKSVDTKTKHAGENTKVVTASHGPVEDSIFDGLEIAKPKLTSYKRTMGPQGRRLPQRYSNQVQSQRFSNQSNSSLAAVSA